MTAETSNARGEWVLVPREPTKAMIDAWRDAPDIWEDAYAAMLAAAPPPPADAEVWVFKGTDGAWRTFHNEQHRLDTIADGRWEVRKFYALSPAALRRDVRELVTLAEQMERDAAGCRRDGYIDAAVVKEDCAQRIRQTLGISAIAEALSAEGAKAGEVSAYDLAVLDDAAETLDRIGEGSAGLREARARIASALSQQPEAQAQGGGEVVAWRVPVLQSPFGEWLDHGVRDGLVLVMHRGTHGWKAAGQGHAMLAHQIYVKNVEPLCATSHEVAVVGLSGGGWRTVWARSDDDVTHPAPPSAPVGVEAIAAEIRASLVRGATVCTRRRWAIELEALAQQPAAVDEAYPTPRNRAEAVALARLALAHLGVIDAHIDAAIARCETNSATKHQEPTTCKHDFRRDEDHGGACCQLCGEVRQ